MTKTRRHRGAFLLFCLLSLLCLSSCDPGEEIVAVVQVDTGPRFRSVAAQALYLEMRDGVRVAVDVILPQPRARALELPAIVEMTRYWRAVQNEGIPEHMTYAALNGYAYVVVDERGTGASFGTWPYPWSETSLEDFEEVVDWVVQQSWSNGAVGAFGGSYPGMTAQLLASRNHPAVRAVVPGYTQFDVYTDIAFPGGIFLEWFVEHWSELALSLDRNEWPDDPGRSVKRVDNDLDASDRSAAVAQHAANGDVFEGLRDVVFRDETSALGISLDEISPHRVADGFEQSGAAVYAWGSWLDHTTAHSVITRFLTLDVPQRAVIGAWTHGGGQHASPYVPVASPPDPGRDTQFREVLNFFDRYLKHDATGAGEKSLFYYTMGEERWKSTTVWPVPGTVRERWYLASDNALSRGAPTTNDAGDDYAVDFTATTGPYTRWHTPLGIDTVYYADRRQADEKLLTYTSTPLAEDMEITGYPIVTLHVSSTHSDGAFYVYLEEIDEGGNVTYVTEGQLQALHRKTSTDAPYATLVPYHSFESGDAQPLVPGEVATLEFGLLPTSVLIRQGHRLRVAIAGHDAGLFARVPETGEPVITVRRDAAYPSMIELPVVR